MEMVELTIQKREGTGKGPARRLRRAGHVPAVLYGVGTPEHSGLPARRARLIHVHEGSTRILRSPSPARGVKMAIIRNMQFDPAPRTSRRPTGGRDGPPIRSVGRPSRG